VVQAAAATIAVGVVGTIIEWAMSVMCGRKTGRQIAEKIVKWTAERTGMKIDGLIQAENSEVSTVPTAWQVSMGVRGVKMPGRFRWIGITVRSELISTRDRRGRNERDSREGTEQNSYTKRRQRAM
jgi:hypothetical protein